jgi:alkane 1-monooxygenase
MRAAQYLLAYSVPLLVAATLGRGDWQVWIPVVYGFLIIPALELLVGPATSNLGAAAEDRARRSRLYSVILWSFVPIQYGLIFYFGWLVSRGLPHWSITLGMVLSMTLSNGGIGITIAHELVHRHRRWERWLGESLLASVLYMHFAIEHVRGHHAQVATLHDPATARRGESVYRFWWPSVSGQVRSAWNLETVRLRKLGHSVWGPHNQMLWFAGWQFALCLTLSLLFGPVFLGIFVVTAILSFSLLEVVNYIEHYGLQRQQRSDGSYQRVTAAHSWNSNAIISRCLLFELTRHSDHHAVASRPYQILRTHPDAPQLPTGYSGMILLALIPPLWFRCMDPRLPPQSPAGDAAGPATPQA